MPQEERAQIDAVGRRLAQKYAQLPNDHVAGVVEQVYATFNHSRLRGFVPLLVEKRAAEELASSTASRLPFGVSRGELLRDSGGKPGSSFDPAAKPHGGAVVEPGVGAR
ncbi:three-helix bundle dimerization domain-containing protein [Mycobacterium sp. 1164966.3]|uniref:three-helix bundle dimerization domain-containing protein n=1 Tax=Mycobacterium sp. 1164966.3 TaxID=1856861 RepID=UPI0012E8B991|nr:hypothetical protein [Mycobacterium sp. 1164966.3]